jgi:hypothetical protein
MDAETMSVLNEEVRRVATAVNLYYKTKFELCERTLQAQEKNANANESITKSLNLIAQSMAFSPGNIGYQEEEESFTEAVEPKTNKKKRTSKKAQLPPIA